MPTPMYCNLCSREVDHLVFQCPICMRGTCPDCYKTSHIAECRNAFCSEYKQEQQLQSQLQPQIPAFSNSFTVQGNGKPMSIDFQIKDGGFYNEEEGLHGAIKSSSLSLPSNDKYREIISLKINGISLMVTKIIKGELVIQHDYNKAEIVRIPFVNGNYSFNFQSQLNYSYFKDPSFKNICFLITKAKINEETEAKLIIYYDFIFKS